MTGKIIYPGLIDAYTETTLEPSGGGARHWSALITPELDVSDAYRSDSGLAEKLRKQGVVARLVAPATGIVKGQSALVTTGDEPNRKSLLRSQVAQHVRLTVPRNRGRDSYPNSPMGAVALARQTFLDAQWYRQAWDAYRVNTLLPRPDQNDALESLAQSIHRQHTMIFDCANELYLLRADAFAREFSLNAILRGSGQEYQRLDAVRATGRALIIPVNFPKPPAVKPPKQRGWSSCRI